MPKEKIVNGWVPALEAAKSIHDRLKVPVFWAPKGKYRYVITTRPDAHPNQKQFIFEN